MSWNLALQINKLASITRVSGSSVLIYNTSNILLATYATTGLFLGDATSGTSSAGGNSILLPSYGAITWAGQSLTPPSILTGGGSSLYFRTAGANYFQNIAGTAKSNIDFGYNTDINTSNLSLGLQLTSASAPYQINTFNGANAVYKLPNTPSATFGTFFIFHNLTTANSMIIQNFSASTIYTLPAGGKVTATLYDTVFPAGLWSFRAELPQDATFGSAGLNCSGTMSITATNLNGKLGIVGASTASGNVVLCNNTSNTSGNFDLQTDSDQHLTFSGGTGPGSNVLSVGGTTNGAITVPSTAGSITVNTARLWTGAGNLGGNIVLGSSTSGNNLTGAGQNNTIVGSDAGNALTSGSINTFVGSVCGDANTTGAGNVGVGAGAMGQSTTGNNNSAIGRDALSGVMTGDQNIGIGYNTGVVTSGNNNTLIGQAVARSLTTGSGNICIGYDVVNTGTALVSGNYNCYIGYGANASSASVSSEICIGQVVGKGASSIALAGTALYLPDYITGAGTLQITAGNLVTIISDQRAKENIVYLSSQGELEKLLQIRPATYTLKSDPDYDKKSYTNIIAQDVEKIFPDVIDGKKYEYEYVKKPTGGFLFDDEGNPIPVLDENGNKKPRFRGFDANALLSHTILAVQEQHAIITDLKAQLASLKATVDALVAQKEILVV